MPRGQVAALILQFQVGEMFENVKKWFSTTAYERAEEKELEIQDRINYEVDQVANQIYDIQHASHQGFQSQGAFVEYDGEKFPGGFGEGRVYNLDYLALKIKSSQVFHDNLYARGLIRRLVTNEINTGLKLEACPDEETLGVEADSLGDWSEKVENRFKLWGSEKTVCDWKNQKTWPQLQYEARQEALIEGDILVVSRMDKFTKMPKVQFISGRRVVTPLIEDSKLKKGHKIKNGVELDEKGTHVAYWIKQDNAKIERMEAWGKKSGRRIAWLLYGTDKRKHEERGEPLLSIVLQSIREIDRYRDATQRKATINSILAIFIKKMQDAIGTTPMIQGATRTQTVQLPTEDPNVKRPWKIAQQIPGLTIETLQQGEEPVGFGNNGVDEKFGEFESAIIHAIAWANEVPPEILNLAFSSNYSASAAAINEFKIYLDKIRFHFGIEFCQPFYSEWLVQETLLRRIDAPGFIEAFRNPTEYETYGAWLEAEWIGAVKPSTDQKKTAQAYKLMREEGYITSARATSEMTGMKFSKNMKTIKRENILIIEAARPMAEFQREFAQSPEEISALFENNPLLQAAYDQYLAVNDTETKELEESGDDDDMEIGTSFKRNGNTYIIDDDGVIAHYEDVECAS